MAIYEIYKSIQDGNTKFHVKDARQDLTLADYFMSGSLGDVRKHLSTVRDLASSDEIRTIPERVNIKGIDYFPVTDEDVGKTLDELNFHPWWR